MEFSNATGGDRKLARSFSFEELGKLVAEKLEGEVGEGLGESYSISFNWSTETVEIWVAK